VIFPRDQCVVESGKLDLLGVTREPKQGSPSGSALRVDGKPWKWELYKEPTLLSRLQLAPGRHQITIGSGRLRVYVRGKSSAEDEPNGWPVFRTHLGATEGWKDCATCHELTKDGARTVVGDPMEPAACSQCHSSTEFEVAHFHPEEPLASCQMCHALHGSSRESLLKAPVKTLCANCHD